MVLAYDPNVGGGLASGVEKLTNAYLEKQRRKGLASGLQQINSGDWAGGINTIAEKSPDTALSLAQYKQSADNDFAMQQMKEEAAERARNTITPYQQEMLNLSRQRLAQSQSGESNPFSSKNEFINLMGIRNNPQVWGSLPDDQKQLINARLNYMSNAPENIYDVSYQKKAGTLEAEVRKKENEAQKQSEEQGKAIDDLVSDIDANPELFGVYSPYRAGISRMTGGKYGYSPEQLEQRGNMIRQVGAIQNSIIAEAKAAGQSGINTVSEIKQATKGLDENSSPEEVKGALRAMQKARMKYLGKTGTQQKDYSNASDDDILQGLR